jgi:O-antigen/teichoic acid export membrane protein
LQYLRLSPEALSPMSRFQRIVHAAASSYAVLFATAIYSLASVPLALHYLSKERFALWVLMASIGGYLSLIELGMSGSVARLLIDHKDDPQHGAYGSLVKTGWLVLAVQAVLIFAAGAVLAPILAELLAIEPALQGEFVQLMRWQSLALALGVALRISSHLLYAHQRMDLVNYVGIGSLGLNFALLWLFFQAGHGVFSLAWAGLLSSFVGSLISLVACAQLRLFPPAGAWGQGSWKDFKAIFAFGKDLVLVAVGGQLIMASQAMIITRVLGLQAAAGWGIGTRAFALVSQLVWRIADVSGPAFSEMIVRGEHVLLQARYKTMVILTASLSAFAAVSYALCNGAFVEVWTHGKFVWPPFNDVLLGAWLIVLSILHCHNCFILLTKKVGFMRYVYFVEGVVFVTAAFLTVKRGGLPAVIGCSLVCSTLFSGAYGIWRVSRYFGCSVYEVGLAWLAPAGRVLGLFAPVAAATWWVSGQIDPPLARLAFNTLIAGSVGCFLFLRYGLSLGIQDELLRRAPKALTSILKRVFVSSS